MRDAANAVTKNHIFNLNMDQPRISPPTATKQSSTNKKRSMVSEHESDFEDPLPAKKLAKIF